MITDRLRFTVIETNTNKILSRDLVVMQPQVMVSLSGPCHTQFKMPQGESTGSAAGIKWKNFGQWIITEIEVDGVQKIFSAGIVTAHKIDRASGELSIEATGFSNYTKGIPWLENYNPIAVDPFEIVQRVWAHVQSYDNANLGVQVVPASSGTQMLPGYGFTTQALNFDFWAIFIRAVDFNDCGDLIQSLARDIPFDYYEEAAWDTGQNQFKIDTIKVLKAMELHGGAGNSVSVALKDTEGATGMVTLINSFFVDTVVATSSGSNVIIDANVSMDDWNNVVVNAFQGLGVTSTSALEEGRQEVLKTLRLAYPYGGLKQVHLAFRLGENITEAEMAEEKDIEPVSDVIIRGWLPGKAYSSVLSDVDEEGNPRDMTRLRRTIMEEDVNINSAERAAAWAKKKLIRRNIPLSFQKLIIDPNHPNAPYGSFDIGDTIYVEAYGYPWHGDIVGWHRVTTITYDQDSGTMELGLKVEGAFNYDPIVYDPDLGQGAAVDTNRVINGYFGSNISGWTAVQGQWIRVDGFTYSTHYHTDSGCVRIDCDDHGEKFLSSAIAITPGEHLKIQSAVRWVDIVSGINDEFQLLGFLYFNDTLVTTVKFDYYLHPSGSHGWELLEKSDWTVPKQVNKLKLQFTVTSGVTAGHAFWTYARVTPVVKVPITA